MARVSDFDAWLATGADEVALAEELRGAGNDRLRPTGVSNDEYTIFLWDAAEGTALAARRNPQTGEVDAWDELGEVRGATPNADCSRLYYSAADASLDLFVADLD